MRTLLATMVLLLACCGMSSCNLVAGVSYAFTPDPSQDAEYVLPDRRTVVFVDDRRNVMHPTRLRRVIAERVTRDLLSNEILTIVVSPRDVMRVSAANDRHNEPLSVAQLGRAVDASVIIYIEMGAFGLTSDGRTANPRASCTVRVIDVEQKSRLFPTDEVAHPIFTNLERIDPHRIESGGEIRKLAEELAEKLGDSIAKVFYTHNTGRLGDNLNRK
jgi:hypothetical protein